MTEELLKQADEFIAAFQLTEDGEYVKAAKAYRNLPIATSELIKALADELRGKEELKEALTDYVQATNSTHNISRVVSEARTNEDIKDEIAAGILKEILAHERAELILSKYTLPQPPKED
jgi:hypothetical protein